MELNDRTYAFFIQGKDLDSGLQLIDQALEIEPENFYALSTKAELLCAKGDLGLALNTINKALHNNPDNIELLENLEMILEALSGNGK